jgi:hypothetical protein
MSSIWNSIHVMYGLIWGMWGNIHIYLFYYLMHESTYNYLKNIFFTTFLLSYIYKYFRTFCISV